MSLHCVVCENRIKLKKSRTFFSPQFNHTKYCSIRCFTAAYRYLFLGIGVFCIAVYIGVGVPLFANDADLWWLFIIMFPLPFIGLIGLIGGLIASRVHYSIKKKLRETRYFCFHCKSDITHSSNQGSLLCDNCGNKVLYCNLCSKIINPDEEIAVVKPCQHAFHKAELLDFAEEGYTCPRCGGEIHELSFKLDKNDEQFWIKTK
jgi:DNA-directed RNA polymerase subunit RPC12/RpoP